MVDDRWISLDATDPFSLHIREWPGGDPSNGPPFILLHGLASNARTWDLVADALAAHGYRVIAVDQRGHGLSDKPDGGYDFATIAADLRTLLDRLEIEQSIVVGQSWGGNVALAFGVAYPTRVHGLGFVDGGYLDLQMRPGNTWESVAQDLKPPSLAGTPAVDLAARLRQAHPDWSNAGIDMTMANFEVLADGAVRPWLTLERHMLILRSLWEQQPGALYSQVRSPVYIAVAENARNPGWMAVKARQVATAEAGLAEVQVEWFPETDHDIHVHKPDQLAESLMVQLRDGIWSGTGNR